MAEKLLMSQDEIHRALSRIAHEVLERNRGVDDLVLVGMHTRGVPLARRLADRIGQPGRPRGGREHHHAERGAVRHDEPGAPRGAVPLLPARLASQQRGPRLPHRRHGR